MIDTSEHPPGNINETIVLEAEREKDECGYCGTDCAVPPEQWQHAEDCPFITGLWPIEGFYRTGAVHTFVCPNCEEHTVHYSCVRCERFFEDEDVYRLVDSETGLLIVYALNPQRGLGICTDCAQKQADALRAMLS